jgi:catecholate siderophore receptor
MAQKRRQRRPAFVFNPISAAIAMAMAPTAAWPQAFEQPPAAGAPAQDPAAAESAPAEPPAADDAQPLDPVEVKGQQADGDFAPVGAASMKPPMSIRDTPQSITVITRPVMDSQAAASVKDALRYVPGITISAGEGGQIGDNFNLRGFTARTDVYLDGFRDRGQYSRDVFFLESVEVLKGPSSMLFGRGSTGGVINQVTKQPKPEAASELSSTFGTDEYYRVTADFNTPLSDGSAARLAVMAQDLQTTRDVVQNEDYGFAPSLRFGMGSALDLTVYGLLLRNDDLPDYGFPLLTENGPGTVATPIKAPADNFYGFTDDRFIQDVASAGATLSYQINPLLQLRQRVQTAVYETEASPSPLTVRTGETPTQQMDLDDITMVRQDRDREIRDTSLFSQTDLVARFRTGAVAHTLTTGLEVGDDKFESDNFQYVRTAAETAAMEINLGNPVNGTRPGDRYQSAATVTRADTTGVYVNEQAELGEHWQVVAGIRWDEFDAKSSTVNFDSDGTLADPQPAQPAPQNDRMWSPRAGVIFQPTEQQSYYVSYGTSFNPTAEAITQSSGNTAANASLEPEENRSYEVGAKWTLAEGSLELSSAVFRVEKDNARYSDPAVGPSLQSNAGEARVEGFEVAAVGRITDAWQLIGGYTWLDSEIVESPEVGNAGTVNAGIPAEGKRFPNTPEHAATLWNTWRLPGGWEAGAGAVHVGERTLNNFETAKVEGYTRGDAMVGFSRPSFNLRLNLLNVTDELYFDAALGGRATPARGRTALLTGTMRFGGFGGR